MVKSTKLSVKDSPPVKELNEITKKIIIEQITEVEQLNT